jgi:prefoldin subunit 5
MKDKDKEIEKLNDKIEKLEKEIEKLARVSNNTIEILK